MFLNVIAVANTVVETALATVSAIVNAGVLTPVVISVTATVDGTVDYTPCTSCIVDAGYSNYDNIHLTQVELPSL